MENQIQLYNYFRSSTSYRVRIALNFKKLKYDYIPVHLLNDGGEQNKEGFIQLNPQKEVPTLIHNGFVLSQSLPIIEYLDEVFRSNQQQRQLCVKFVKILILFYIQ